MKEKHFQQEVARSIPWLREQAGRHIEYLKIPDAPLGPNARFGARKGYDFFLVDQGLHIAVEAKQTKDMSISLDKVNDHQEACLKAVLQAGGEAFVLVNFRCVASGRAAKGRAPGKIIAAFAVHADRWFAERGEPGASTRRLDWFEERAIAIPKIRLSNGTIGWDLRPLLQDADALLASTPSSSPSSEVARAERATQALLWWPRRPPGGELPVGRQSTRRGAPQVWTNASRAGGSRWLRSVLRDAHVPRLLHHRERRRGRCHGARAGRPVACRRLGMVSRARLPAALVARAADQEAEDAAPGAVRLQPRPCDRRQEGAVPRLPTVNLTFR